MRNRVQNRVSLDFLFLRPIELYQRRISPRKGWRCAYSVLHGGAGCSGYIQSAIGERGWREAQVLARKRFRQCQLAAQVLRAGADVDSSPKTGRKRHQRNGAANSWCDSNACLCADAAFDCGPGDIGCCDCNPCG